jgi:hypothetical protein
MRGEDVIFMDQGQFDKTTWESLSDSGADPLDTLKTIRRLEVGPVQVERRLHGTGKSIP